MSFTGFPREGVEFFAELEDNNNRDWWLAHKSVFETAVRRPLEYVLDTLAPEFDAARTKIFRPNRDVRFSADKSPYKTHQGGYLETAQGSAYYLQLSADGLLVGSGAYQLAPDQLARFRAAVNEETSGGELARLVDALAQHGYELGGEQVATRPRGVAADHPRLELMRLKGIHAGRAFGVPHWLATPEVLDHIRDAFDASRELVAWLDQCVGPTELTRGR